MAFDPDAFLAQARGPSTGKVTIPKAPPAELVVPEVLAQQVAPPTPVPAAPSFDPDAFLSGDEKKPDVSKLESAGRGILQGISLGFSDEITGLVESAFTRKTYDQVIREARQANKVAKEANPWIYGLSEVAGGVGAGVATGGAAAAAKLGVAGVKGAAALAATEGAVQGIGTAEGGVGEHVQSALIGGAAGGALGAAGAKIFGRYAKNAPGRVDDRAFIEMTGGPGKASVPTSLRDPMIDNREGITSLLDAEDFRAVHRDPEALKEAAGKASARLGSEIEGGWAELHKGIEVDATQVLDELATLKASTKLPQNQKRVQSLIEAIEERYAPAAQRDLSGAAGIEIDASDVLKRLQDARKAAKTPSNVSKVETLIEAIEDRWVPEKPLDDRRLLQLLTEGGKAQTKTKLAVRKDTALEVAKKHGLDKAVRDPIASKDATDKAVTVVGQRISDMYDQVDGIEGLDDTLRGMDLDRVVSPLDDLVKEYAANPATQTEAGKVRGLIENMRKVWGGEDLSVLQGAADMPEVPKKVLARQLRELVTTVQSRGFGAGDVLDPDAAKQLQRDIANRLKGTLDDYLDEQGALGDINGLNREISVLLDFQKAADKRAAAYQLKDLPPAPVKKTGKMTAEELNQLVSELPQDQKTLGKVRASLEDLLDNSLPKRDIKPPTIPAGELDSLIREVSASLPRKPKIISTRDDIDFGAEKAPKILEKARDRLSKLLEFKLPDKSKAQALRDKEARKELVNLVGGASVYRQRADVGRKTGLRTIIGEQANKNAANMETLAAGVGAVAVSPYLAALKPVSWTGRKVAGAIGKTASKTYWKTTDYLADLVRSANKGDVSKKQYLDAIQAGVAATTALGVLNAAKNRPAWLRDFDRDEE